MQPSARDNVTTRTLLRLVHERVTGRLEVGAGAAKLTVFLLHGDVVAATCQEDERQYLRLLSQTGALPASAVEALEEQLERSETIFGELLDLAAAPLIPLLAERFHQNLCDSLRSLSRPNFTAQRAVFVDNLQLGHDTLQYLADACDTCDRVASLDLDATVQRGHTPPGSPLGEQVLSLLAQSTKTIHALLLALPLEPIRAQLLLLSLLEQGTIQPPQPVLQSVPLPVDDEDDDDDAPTVQGVDLDSLLDELEADALGDEEGLDEVEVEELSEEPQPEALLDEAEEEVDKVEEDFQEAEASSTGVPSSLADWLSSATAVDEDELDFFSDHDYDRGQGEGGNFSTQSHNLDKVEVADLSTDSPDEVIAVDEAPTAAYSAPVLSEDDAMHKVIVTNEVLATLSAAFDAAEGSGRGSSVVQLLVDGGPAKFKLLFKDVQVEAHGQLPGDAILDNLYSRPASEHRQLIHNAMLDIIERALSYGADELPEEAFDTLFESVAGYRQRLGR